jgi:hypothetical protein
MARSVVTQIIDLGDAHKLDGLLGGYEDTTEQVITNLKPGDPVERSDQPRELAKALIAKLVTHVEKNPRDVGQT